MKYRLIVGTGPDIQEDLNTLADRYTPQQLVALQGDDGTVGYCVLLRARSEEPDPEENWCTHQDAKGKRCLFDAVRDGYCKKHWRENADAAARARDK